MPVDSSGNITRPSSPVPVTGQTADAPQVNVPIDDMINSMNMFMFLDGRKPLRGNIPMNGYRARGAADAEQPQDYVTLAQLQSALSGAATVPTGVIMSYTGTSAPSGWVHANGQSLSRATFPNLWAFVQSSGNLAASEGAKQAGQYGPGNGSTTFTVPNLYTAGGYFIRPITSGRGIGTVQGFAVQSHSHTGSTENSGVHAHSLSGTANTAGSHTHGGTALNAGGHAHNTTVVGVLGDGGSIGGFFAKANGTSVYQQAFVSSENGVHSHNLNINIGGGHTHTISGAANAAGSHSHSFTTNNAGSEETRPNNVAYPFIIKT